MKFTTILTSMPPPLSACYNNIAGRGRVKSKKYKAWIVEQMYADQMLRCYSDPLIKVPVKLVVAIYKPDRRKRDLDNLWKPICDLMVSCKILEDDSLIHDERMFWTPHSHRPVVINIETVADPVL